MYRMMLAAAVAALIAGAPAMAAAPARLKAEAAAKVEAQAKLAKVPSEVLAAELQRRGWAVIGP